MKRFIPILLLLSVSLFACDYQFDIPDVDPPGENVDPPLPSIPSTPSINMLKYRPHNYTMWDNWCIVEGDSIHLFHLQYTMSNVVYDKDVDKRGFGHATSGDLLRWSEKPEVLTLYDRQFDNDWNFRYTGSTIKHNGKYYTYYTMRKWGMQRIGLATSDDLYNWKEYEGNPVLEPDGRWFITFNAEGTGSNHPVWKDIVDCRDMLVIKDKNGSGYYGYFISSADRNNLSSPTSVVGIAYSNDLISWEQKGIVYYPTGVSMPEMIDVFEINDKWYMTLTTGKNNGGLSDFSDQYISRGMMYATSSSPEGPFVEDSSDNIVIGGSINSGYSMRSVEYKGKRRMMYVDVNNGLSVLSLPKDVGLNANNRLRLLYSSDLLSALRVRDIEPTILAQPNNTFGWWPTHGGTWKKENGNFVGVTDPQSWQGMVFDGTSNNMEVNFTVKASAVESYGFFLCNKAETITFSDIAHILVVEPDKNRLYLTDNLWDFKNCRSFDFEPDKEYIFKVLLVGNTIEVYINNEFVFNSGINNAKNYYPGIFANNGTMTVSDVKYYEIQE